MHLQVDWRDLIPVRGLASLCRSDDDDDDYDDGDDDPTLPFPLIPPETTIAAIKS